jgi:hypothetical protein
VRSLAFLSLVLAIQACAAKPSPIDPRLAQEDEAPQRVQKRGFAVGLPPNASWYIDVSDQGPERFVARRAMSGAHYSFFFEVDLSKLARAPKSLADFAELARQDTVADPTRDKIVTYKQSTETLQQQWCIRYALTTAEYDNDLFAGVPVNVQVNGLICKHPSWPDVAVDMSYSARGIGREFKPDPELDAEGEALLKSVTIETEPANSAG